METIHVIRKRSVKRSKISDTASVLDAARALSNEFKDYVMSGVGKGEIVLGRIGRNIRPTATESSKKHLPCKAPSGTEEVMRDLQNLADPRTENPNQRVYA